MLIITQLYAQNWGQKTQRFGQYPLYVRVVTDTSGIDKADGNLYQYSDNFYIGTGTYLKKLAQSALSGIPGLSDSLSTHFGLITALDTKIDNSKEINILDC